MSHIPINHHLRGFYRGIATIIGLYLLAFGIVGLIRCWGDPFFDRGDVTSLGLTTNMALSVLSVIAGLVLLVATFAVRDGHLVYMVLGWTFVVAGLILLAISRTDANKLNATVGTCVVAFVIGPLLILAGLYTRTGSTAEAVAEERFRHISAANA
jgi:hypothetical protein